MVWVNLAGVDIILRLKEKLDELDKMTGDLREDLAKHQGKNNILQTQQSSYEIIVFQKK